MAGMGLEFLATWTATTAECTDPAFNGRTLVLRQAARIERVGPGKVQGPTVLQLCPDSGCPTWEEVSIVSRTYGRVTGTISCTTTVCSIDLDTKTAGRRVQFSGGGILEVNRLTGAVLSFRPNDAADSTLGQ
jgi:hypothetical protein